MILVDPKVDPEADKLQVSTLIDRPTGPPTPNERSKILISQSGAAVEGVVYVIRPLSVFGPH